MVKAHIPVGSRDSSPDQVSQSVFHMDRVAHFVFRTPITAEDCPAGTPAEPVPTSPPPPPGSPHQSTGQINDELSY